MDQEELLSKLRLKGADTSLAEELLAEFDATLRLHRTDRDYIASELGRWLGRNREVPERPELQRTLQLRALIVEPKKRTAQQLQRSAHDATRAFNVIAGILAGCGAGGSDSSRLGTCTGKV